MMLNLEKWKRPWVVRIGLGLFLCFYVAWVIRFYQREALDRTAQASLWRVGCKLFFEEEGGHGYMGLRPLQRVVKAQLQPYLQPIEADHVGERAAKFIFQAGRQGTVLRAYEESSRPGIPEPMHATLLYTRPRGFCDSETLSQIVESLLGKKAAKKPPTLAQVAHAYTAILGNEARFQIQEVVLHSTGSGGHCLSALLQFEGQNRLHHEGRPVSAGLHLTLASFIEQTLWMSPTHQSEALAQLNQMLVGQSVQAAYRNGAPDLELGISGARWRLRAGKRVDLP